MFATSSASEKNTIADLYRSHGGIVLRRARQITGSEVEAEEVLQELFRKLLERPESLGQARSPTSWLYGATTHLCLNRIRNRKNRERLLRENVTPVEAQQTPAELRAIVQQALGMLPEELSAVFVYYYLDQMTHSEIADVVNCSRRQVGNLLERAHANLERLMAQEKGPSDE